MTCNRCRVETDQLHKMRGYPDVCGACLSEFHVLLVQGLRAALRSEGIDPDEVERTDDGIRA